MFRITRVSLVLALAGGAGIVLLDFIKQNPVHLPMHLGAWFTGVTLGWAVMYLLWLRRRS
ncbi:hypothetical protein [Desulfofundulus australicus]|uniref:hypothetical protein n=1 Tax=Desulfofundulus australicus TaxID=1566 RepID=UPI000933223F|nr:hypothetical protein [Desulfofundulus australicus]